MNNCAFGATSLMESELLCLETEFWSLECEFLSANGYSASLRLGGFGISLRFQYQTYIWVVFSVKLAIG